MQSLCECKFVQYLLEKKKCVGTDFILKENLSVLLISKILFIFVFLNFFVGRL